MPDLITILLVEDSQEDANLLTQQLLQDGLNFSCCRVENAAGLQAALLEQDWSLMIAACTLADFDARSALVILQSSGREMPFIVILDNNSQEENALAFMKSGAQNYVIKGSLARLVPVVEHVLEDARQRSEQKHATEVLRQSEERYRMVVEQASDGIFIADSTGRYVEVNSSGCAILGYSREEILQLSMRDLVASEDVALTPLKMDELRAGKVVLSERSMIRKDGSHVLVEISGKMLADGSMQGIVRDITLRKRTEQAILRLNRVYAVISQINQMVARTRQKDELLKGICQITVEYGKFRMVWFGLVDEETLTVKPTAMAGVEDGYLQIIPAILVSDVPQGRGPTGTAIRSGKYFFCNDIANDPSMQPWREQALRRGYRSSIALPIIINEKVIGAFTIYAAEPFFFNSYEINLLQEVASDIGFALEKIDSEQKRIQAEGELRQLALQWQQTFDSSSDGICLLDSEQRILRANKAMQSICSMNLDEMLGRNCWEVAHGIDQPTPECSIQALRQTLRREGSEIQLNGVWFDVTIDPILGQNGQPTGFVHVLRDINARKQAEEQLREAHARLEQRVLDRTAELNLANIALQKAARMKDEFLASMSHELRTPLTGILGLSESMLMNTYGGLNQDQQNALMGIERSGRHLLDLINDILDLSKIEAGKLELQPAPFSLDGVCQASLQMVSGLARQKHLQTSFSMDPVSIVLNGDARRIKQMLVNLLSNAVKFTSENGSIGIDVVGNLQQQKVSISIWDTGIGIRAEDLPRLFQPFVQLDSSLSRQYSGTGLGLSLVQRLSEMHGGSVQVESVPGQGSRFTILLPWEMLDPLALAPRRRMTDNLPSPNLKSSVQPGPKVLAVDDNPVMLEVFGDYLGAQNFTFIATHSGDEFLERLEKINPDILLVDIQMPGMDGLEIIKRIRSHSEARISTLPVVAVTALAMTGDRERCLAAGANEYMSKPVELAILPGTLRNLINQSHKVQQP